MSSMHAISAQSPQPQTNSAPSSPTSATRVGKPRVSSPTVREGADQDNGALVHTRATDTLLSACAAVADELAASRTLIDALENENAALKTRLDTEKRTTALLAELNETGKSETAALRSALAAKNEALTAKDSVIASQDKLIVTLKRKKSSPWKRIGDVLVGVGIGVLFR
jgi:hypothetical protein